MEFDAVILAGGRAARLGGADKAALEVGGVTLLERALAAVAGARRVVVVGDERPTSRPVLWTREQPVYGGPVAAAYAGLDALRRDSPVRLSGEAGPRAPTHPHGTIPTDDLVVVVAVDMPGFTAETVDRLLGGANGRDGAVLADGGRQHLAMAVTARALDRVRPDPVEGAAMRGLWAALDLAEVAAIGSEAGDVDMWADLP